MGIRVYVTFRCRKATWVDVSQLKRESWIAGWLVSEFGRNTKPKEFKEVKIYFSFGHLGRDGRHHF